MPIRFQVDPDFYDHPKTLGMGDAATALWVRAGSYSAAKLTDGFVADAALALLSQTPMEAARELIRRGLWSRVRGGYVFHEWGDRNLLRARVEAERGADRERKRKERQAATNGKKGQVNGSSVRSDGEPDSRGSPDGVRSLSVSVSESVSGSVSGPGSAPSASSLTAVGPEPPRRCPNHQRQAADGSCGGCAEARRVHGQWEADRNEHHRLAAKCRAHRGQLAASCALCAAEAKGAA